MLVGKQNLVQGSNIRVGGRWRRVLDVTRPIYNLQKWDSYHSPHPFLLKLLLKGCFSITTIMTPLSILYFILGEHEQPSLSKHNGNPPTLLLL